VRDRIDRRYALLLGIVLTCWALTNDLLLSPPDLSDDPVPTATTQPVSRDRPAARPGPGPGAAGPDAPAAG
jgi:hypothetical protein